MARVSGYEWESSLTCFDLRTDVFTGRRVGHAMFRSKVRKQSLKTSQDRLHEKEESWSVSPRTSVLDTVVDMGWYHIALLLSLILPEYAPFPGSSLRLCEQQLALQYGPSWQQRDISQLLRFHRCAGRNTRQGYHL